MQSGTGSRRRSLVERVVHLGSMPRISDIRCPHCGETSLSSGTNPVAPFCSPRCKLADLSRWLDGSYRIAGDPVSPMDEALDDPRRGS